MTALFWLAYVFFRLRNGSLRGRLVCTVFLPDEIWARLMINLNCKTVNRRPMIYHFGPHHVAEEIRRSSGGFRPRRSWKLHALCFSFAFERASVQSGELTAPKSHETTQKNECKYTSLIWLSLSGFWGWNVTICGIYKTFLGITSVLPRSTVAYYKQCKCSTSESKSLRNVASNPQGCLPVAYGFKIFKKQTLRHEAMHKREYSKQVLYRVRQN